MKMSLSNRDFYFSPNCYSRYIRNSTESARKDKNQLFLGLTRLRTIKERHYVDNWQEPKAPELSTTFSSRKIERVKTQNPQSSNQSMTLVDYLACLKKLRNLANSHQKVKTTPNKHFELHPQFHRRQASTNEKNLKKRIGIQNYMPKVYKLLMENSIPKQISTISEQYEQFRRYGYSEGKINSVVILCCQKKQLAENIFLSCQPRKERFYYRTFEDIFTNVKKLALIGSDRDVQFIIRQIKDFKKVLEEQSICRGLRKINEIQQSIAVGIERLKTFDVAGAETKDRLKAKERKEQADQIISQVFKTEEKLGAYNRITRISRKLHQGLLKAEAAVSEQFRKSQRAMNRLLKK